MAWTRAIDCGAITTPGSGRRRQDHSSEHVHQGSRGLGLHLQEAAWAAAQVSHQAQWLHLSRHSKEPCRCHHPAPQCHRQPRCRRCHRRGSRAQRLRQASAALQQEWALLRWVAQPAAQQWLRRHQRWRQDSGWAAQVWQVLRQPPAALLRLVSGSIRHCPLRRRLRCLSPDCPARAHHLWVNHRYRQPRWLQPHR